MPDEYINCPMRHKNGNCLPCGGFCLAVNRDICKALRNAYQSGYYDSTIDSLRDVGTIGGYHDE